jgi:putative ABC transport system permease protein
MSALDKKLLRDLWHMRGQVVTVALVVACGIATYVTMRGAHDSIVAAQNSYYGQYRFADVFAQIKRAPESLRQEIAAIPGVAAVQTRIVVEVTLDVPGLDEPAVGRLISIPERRLPILNDLCIRRGRYLEPGWRDEVLVSEAFAMANHLDVGQTIGAVINGRWETLRIVGIALSPEYVYEIRGAEVFPDNRRFGVLWMSREALGPSFNMEGAFNDVTLSLAPGGNEASVIARLDSLLDRYGCLGAYGRDDQISHRFLSDEIAQDRITGIIVPSLFLAVAAFLVHIVLSRLVQTQRNLVGLLKAFGFDNVAVGAHYLKFALAAVLLGTAIGTPLGIWLGSGLARMYQDFFRFPSLEFLAGAKLIGLAIAISGGAACLGALGAVRSAIALPPAEAMRPESPARFRAGLAERFGLQKIFSTSARMILRNLERRPWKAVLSALGMALALALLVVGLYFYDAIAYIVQVEFNTAQRDDVTITLNEPHTSRARFDVEHLPGVLHAEPFRAVAARLRFTHRSRRVGVLGLESGSELRRLIGRDLNAVEIPPDGIVLTAKLAEILHVAPGDTITVEVLEGERPVRPVIVAGVVDELIGVSAYMDVRALNRLMREGRTISGAYLKVDPPAAPKLYSLLKRTPAVQGVAVREAMLKSFDETIARSLNLSTTALVAFACVIAFGLVYNGARIALSERGHELASLRVLGFTTNEIGVMLLGEQGILTLVAVPAGLALGFGICALITRAMESELYRMPLVVSARTYVASFLVVAVSAVLSSLLVFRRLRHLDLVEVLKTRE